MQNYIEMKSSEIRQLKEKIWLSNNKKCPVLDRHIVLEKMVLDHAHKRKDDEYSIDKGVIREALDFRVNAVLGKLENALKRTGLANDKDFDIGSFLRNAADYFEAGAYKDENNNMYIHPNEVKRDPPVSKRNYKKLQKLYDKKQKFPEYPKSRKLTKRLRELFEEYNISPWNQL